MNRKLTLTALAMIGAFGLSLVTSYAQQAPPSVPLLVVGDNRTWIVVRPLEYRIGDTADKIVVPAGFVTDLASIPTAFWGPPLLLTPAGQYSRASIIHDYLYWTQKCTRDQADRLLVIAMKESRVSTFDELTIYDGVHVGGESAWNNNAKAASRGFPRILPEAYRQPADPNMTWPQYAEQLMQQGLDHSIMSTMEPIAITGIQWRCHISRRDRSGRLYPQRHATRKSVPRARPATKA